MRITWNELDELLLPSRHASLVYSYNCRCSRWMDAGEAKPSGAMLC